MLSVLLQESSSLRACIHTVVSAGTKSWSLWPAIEALGKKDLVRSARNQADGGSIPDVEAATPAAVGGI
jgi:hypothetical protein